jgi:3-polyprenyl-4-hydroxybenzoate decarboxylase
MARRGRLVVGMTGASGVIYGIRLLQLLRDHDVETHLVMTKAAKVTLAYESNLKTTGAWAGRCGVSRGRYRRGDFQWFLSQRWHDRRAVLDAQPGAP